MISVWVTNGISRKLLPANALPGRKTFSLSLASGRYAKPSCNVALAVWTRSSLMNARWVTLDPVYNTGISE
jgi:hypothetical protein